MPAFIYCTKWILGQVLPMPYSLTHSQTLKDIATQLLIKYKSGAPVTQSDCYLSEEPATSARSETCCRVRQAMPLTDDVSFDAFLNSPERRRSRPFCQFLATDSIIRISNIKVQKAFLNPTDSCFLFVKFLLIQQ